MIIKLSKANIHTFIETLFCSSFKDRVCYSISACMTLIISDDF